MTRQAHDKKVPLNEKIFIHLLINTLLDDKLGLFHRKTPTFPSIREVPYHCYHIIECVTLAEKKKKMNS